ncbi:MAG TPA: response regulator [Nitrososphaeraceae archaeon]|nr:response regulator [Nitrososphaeraceae archaeon]
MAKKWLVAIVDDELDIVNLFRDALSKIKELSIFTFTDPMIALEHIKMNKSNYAVVISDLRMPDMNGMDLIYNIKKENPLVRTLLMTAFEVNDTVFDEYVKNNIINGFLQKPLKLKDLESEVQKQIKIYKKSRSNEK